MAPIKKKTPVATMTRTALYFAYGSNLDLGQMRARCRSATPLGPATLPGVRLVFAGHSPTRGGGVATVERDADAQVQGLLYTLTEADLAALDRCEGVPFTYDRVLKTVVDEHGRRRRAQVYRLAPDLAEEALPGPRYFGIISRAYERLGFDRAPLSKAADSAAAKAVARLERTRSMTHVFVYGTLRAGECNHRLLQGARLIASARTEPFFRMYSLGGFPGIVPGGETQIVGEVYAVDGAMLARLDRLEGHPDFYTRTPIPLDDGAQAHAYLLRATQVRGKPLIPSGDWRKRAEIQETP